MKVGLVLEGGAMRGLYTEGVLDVLMRNKINVDVIVGVSAGALFGVNFLSKQEGRAIRYSKKYMSNKNFMGIKPLFKEGNVVSTELAYDKVTFELDIFDNETYMKSNTPFYAVLTEIETGEPEYIQITDVYKQLDVLRGSSSMPFVSTPVKIGNKSYLDGGISDSIPFKWLSSQCDKMIVILTRDINYRKKPMSKLLINLFYHHKPNLAKQIYARNTIYNQEIEELIELEKKGKIFIIRPSEEITITRLETAPDKLQAVYELGFKDGVACLEQLKKYMKFNDD